MIERRREGRPTLSTSGIPAASVHLSLPPDEYDRAYDLANRHRISVQRVIRMALKRLLDDERGGSVVIQINEN